MATLIVLLMHIITPLVILSTVGMIFSGEAWFQLMPFISPLLGFWLARLYMKTLKVDSPGRRAIMATITGTVLFWGSCFALVCSMANLPTGW